MQQRPFIALACPLDGLRLQPQGNSMVCAQNHCFDFDRKGTLNLLPVQFKKSLQPGDSTEMVTARQNFLEAGFYQPISDALNQIVIEHTALCQWPYMILDAACGEGYYTARLANGLSALPYENDFSMAGIDISKPAINAAAKRNRLVSWITATNAHIPLGDHSVDCITSLFGFPVAPEFARVLKPSGILVVADTGPEHLIELRRVLYPEIREKNLGKNSLPGFTLMKEQRLHLTAAPPESSLIAAQIAMTPHGFRATAERKQQAIETYYNGMTLDVIFKIYVQDTHWLPG